jgi:RNA polymerase sigma-54 factor
MRIDTGQHMRMDQRMKLAPQMIQSMEILQMAQAALEAKIDQELASNPTLEVREPGTNAEDLEAERAQVDRDNGERERELVVKDGDGTNKDDFERLSNFSEELGSTWDTNSSENGGNYRVAQSSDGERDKKMDAMANTATRTASLFDQIMAQWHLVETTPEIMKLGDYLIGFIDSDGYIRTEMEALLDQAPEGVAEEEIDAAIDMLQQTIEPAGLAARDIRECLLLQIDARLRNDPELKLAHERALVEDHLKDIETNRLPKIAKATGLTIDEIKATIHNLRQFHPHPGKLLADDAPRLIFPDAVIEYDEETDAYSATLTHGRLPTLQIRAEYERDARDKNVDKKTRDYLNNHIRSASWIIDAIQQRKATLLRVIGVVVQAQREFFEQGPQALRPLPMTLVADQLGIHVATVSRAVNEKYLQTPRGILPLRMFFSGGTETEAGDAMSWTAIQAKLEQIIEGEDKSKPLSDDALVEKLKEHGIEIARRTVAKYRKQLNIPPARQRKEF